MQRTTWTQAARFGIDAGRAQGRHLILHQGDQQRDDWSQHQLEHGHRARHGQANPIGVTHRVGLGDRLGINEQDDRQDD